MKKIINSKIGRLIKRLLDANKKYLVHTTSAEVSFYMIASLLSLLVLAIQFLNYNSEVVSQFVYGEVIQLFNETLHPLIIELTKQFTLTGLSAFVFINIIWSTSSILNRYNKFCDRLYEEIAPRKYITNRLNSFLMLAMLLMVILSEIALLVAMKFVLVEVVGIENSFLLPLFGFLGENLALFLVLLIIYINAPPLKVCVSEAIYGAVFSSLFCDIILRIFLLVARLYQMINNSVSITFTFSFAVWLVFAINYCITLGFIINYKIYKMK